MNHPVIYLFTLFLLASCSKEKVDPVGTYKNVGSNIVQNGYQFVFRRSMYSLNNTINLREDSTFVYSYCGGVEKGIWRINGDSVYLVMETFKSSVDSIPVWEYEKGKRVMGFEVNGDELKSREKISLILDSDYDLMNWISFGIVKVKKVSDTDE